MLCCCCCCCCCQLIKHACTHYTGERLLCWVQGIGDDEDVESTSVTTIATEEGYQPVFFDPRPLKNLTPIDEMESLSAIMDMKVGAVPCCVWDVAQNQVTSSPHRLAVT